jgi:hypothetical protein
MSALLVAIVGTAGDGGFAVLEDPTGRRARWLRRSGRVVFLVFLGWLLAIVLAGLGLIPAVGIPLARTLRPSQGPPPLTRIPTPRPPAASDLRPAVTARVFAAKTAKAASRPLSKHAVPGQVKKTATVPAVHGKSAAPGQVKKTATVPSSHGKSVAPGQVKKTTTTTPTTTVAHAKNTAAPGQTKKTTTTTPVAHAKNTTAPGQTKKTTTTTTLPKPKKP